MTRKSPWAVLLCRFKDTVDISISLDRANRFFTSAGSGTFNLPRFISEMSHGMDDASGSMVFPQSSEYFVMDWNLADFFAAPQPLRRTYLVQKARDAAIAGGVNLDCFFGVIVVPNAAIGGAFGHGYFNDRFAVADYRFLMGDPLSPDPALPTQGNGTTTYGHEIVHGYGLHPHSRWESTPIDGTDPGDIFGAFSAWGPGWSADPDFGLRGPGVNAVNMRALGWLDESRVWRAKSSGYNAVVTLRPLHRRDLPGFLAAEVCYSSGPALVEFRVKKDWDAALRSAVWVRSRQGGHSYVLTPTNGGLNMVAGETWEHDPGSVFLRHSRVEVLTIDEVNDSATVRISCGGGMELPHGLSVGVIGQGAADGAGLIWTGRRFVRVPPWNPMARLLDPMASWVTADDLPLAARSIAHRELLRQMQEGLDTTAREMEPDDDQMFTQNVMPGSKRSE